MWRPRRRGRTGSSASRGVLPLRELREGDVRRRRKYPTRILHVRWDNSDEDRPAKGRFACFASSELRAFGRTYELLTALPHEEQPKLLFFAVRGPGLADVDIAAARGFLLPNFDGLA